MDFFCLRKPRYAREKHHRRGTKKHEEKISIIRLEARSRNNPVRDTERDKRTRRRPRAMAHQHPNPPPRDFRDIPALDAEQPFPYRHPQTPRVPTHNSNRDENDANPVVSQGQAQEPPQQLNQIYVHPLSSQHFRFSVVDHSVVCHGATPVLYPVCSFAIVPEVAAVRDVDNALARREELVTMARLRITGELVPIRTFYTIRTLHEATLQLEVWDSGFYDVLTSRTRPSPMLRERWDRSEE